MIDVKKASRNIVSRLRSAQKSGELWNKKVVIMHDFSFDRLVHLDRFEDFMEKACTVLSQKGGLLPESVQTIQQGGCAANAATTLARLGVKPYFITRTNELGVHLLRFYLERAGVDISRVKTGGSLALMTCFEVGREKYNIMINDGDSFGPFGFDDLDGEDLALMESADLVGVFDWCLNPKGTDLARGLFEHLEKKGIVTYYDTSDPSPRKAEIPELYRTVLTKGNLTYLNLNENELKQFTSADRAAETPKELVDLAVSLKQKIHAVLSIHTDTLSIGVDDSVSVAPTYRIKPLRTTGAGDTWNGGNILGILLGLEPGERLLLANAIAGYYIESPDANRSSLEEITEFIRLRENDTYALDHTKPDL
ncbi:MAG: carbohydrate kinase family protein [Spirochaetes bacterium]|nr:carbohydrate kinase family protein [Spirochaetota bacterium]